MERDSIHSAGPVFRAGSARRGGGPRVGPGLLPTLLVASALALGPGLAAAEDEPALRAAVWEHRDRTTKALGAKTLLEGAGFVVSELPFRASALELDVDLVLLGSFISEHPGYWSFMNRHAEGLRSFVQRGGVLIQLTQDDETESSPPFLPPGLEATRGDLDLRYLVANESWSTLLEGLAVATGKWPLLPLDTHPDGACSWDAFVDQSGFRVLLWSDPQIPYRDAALLEGQLGEGRLLLTTLALDKLYDKAGRSDATPAYRAAASRFAENLARYVRLLDAGELPDVEPSRTDAPEPLSHVADSWTLVLLPDTQYYSQSRPEILEAQTSWIVENRDRLEIVYVLHEGDVVHRDDASQWKAARRAMKRLDGVVPYTITTGNHDYYRPGRRLSERKTLLNKYFPVEQASTWPTFGGTFEPGRLENSYHLFEAGGRPWVVLSLEFFPRDDAVAWGAEVLERHSDRTAILVTHAYLSEFDSRIDRRGAARDDPSRANESHLPPGINDGEDLWRKLVSPHANVAFVFSGHVTGFGTGRLTSRGERGQTVHQILANYQMRETGGEGYLRLVEFLPDGRTVQVRTYSPFLDRYMTWDEHQFVLSWPPP